MAKPCVASLGLDCNGFPNLPPSLHSDHLGQLDHWAPSDHSVTYIKKSFDVNTAEAICHSICMTISQPQTTRDMERYIYYGYSNGFERMFIATPNNPQDWINTKYNFPESKFAILNIQGYYSGHITSVDQFPQWFMCSDLSYYNMTPGLNMNDHKYIDMDDKILSSVEIGTTNFGRLLSKLFYYQVPSPFDATERIVFFPDYFNQTEAYKVCTKTVNGRMFEPKTGEHITFLREHMKKTETMEIWMGISKGPYDTWKYLAPGREEVTAAVSNRLSVDNLNRIAFFSHCPPASLKESFMTITMDQTDPDPVMFKDRRQEAIAGK